MLATKDINQPLGPRSVSYEFTYKPNEPISFMLQAIHNKQAVSTISATATSDGKLSLSIESHSGLAFQDNYFVSLVSSFITHLDYELEGRAALLILLNPRQCLDSRELQGFLDFGFNEGNDNIYYEKEDHSLLIKTKSAIFKRINGSQKVGRGYAMCTEDLNQEGLKALAIEYNAVAWGNTSWAAHKELSTDEISIIEKFVSGNVLEIGAGSGRVTAYLAKYTEHLVASDYVPEITTILKDEFSENSNVQIICDDITKTKINTQFDCVCFFENGLGNLLVKSERQLAVDNMILLTKPGGHVILGFRSLGESTEHVMVASVDPIFVGVYHTFSHEEALEYFSKHKGSLEIITGTERPAGGEEFFLVFKKV